MHHVGRVDWSFAETPRPSSATSNGLARQVIVGPKQGADPHGAGRRRARAGRLAPAPRPFVRGGAVRPCRRAGHGHRRGGASPRAGRLRVRPDRHMACPRQWRLEPGPLAERQHAAAAARPRPAAATRSSRPSRSTCGPRRPGPCDRASAHPTTKNVGHYDGTPPQLEALRVDDPVRERRPVGMDTALLAYSGISVKMLVDRGLGRGPAHDVHRRLRGRRRRAGARPPVRGDVLLPRRARSRRSSTGRHTCSARATSCSRASARSTGSGTRAPAACAGSRRRRHNHRPATPIAGSGRGSELEEQGG